MKICSHCKINLPTSQFYKASNNKDKLQTICKACTRKIQIVHEKKMLAREYVEIPESKYCPKCKTVKPSSKFTKDKYRKDGLKSMCKVCDRAKSDKYFKKNFKAVLKTQAKYRVKKIHKRIKNASDK